MRWIGPVAAALLLATSPGGGAARGDVVELINNGGFETGLSGWTRSDQLGSDGTFALQTGTASPVNGIAVPAPPEGLNAAMTDAGGPGSHVMYQDFVVPSDVTGGTLSFERFINNQATDFFAPDTLDFAGVDSTGAPINNQQARVDIILATADPFSVAPADVLQTVFQTQPGDPLTSGYSTVTADLSSLLLAHAGETLRLRFAEADNQTIMNFGVDNVSLRAVPEPTALCGLLIGGSMTVGLAMRRRLRRAR